MLLLLEVPEFPYNTAGQVEESLHAKASSFYPTQHLLVADRQKRAKRDNKYRAIMVLLKWSVRPQVRAFMVCLHVSVTTTQYTITITSCYVQSTLEKHRPLDRHFYPVALNFDL